MVARWPIYHEMFDIRTVVEQLISQNQLKSPKQQSAIWHRRLIQSVIVNNVGTMYCS